MCQLTHSWKQIVLEATPLFTKERSFKTPYFVYEVQRESRNPSNEQEFLELESESKSPFVEIWRCFYDVRKQGFEPVRIDLINLDPLFHYNYQTLEHFISGFMSTGCWTHEEVIASIHKLLSSNPNDFFEHDQQKIERLREIIAQNQSI
ncbi:hypothetical protein NIES592_08010 [Fischerella major NIES-592]|uniref:Uncharacterized protein n=1 Tax=Fischerella major NIES-592 TaxID=210994 RepID=A0A1U7H1I7_9CYAN|nr:hypothetical protein NIES592_08010 [Fischerella major NIES-592]